jgi:hypothetical protein
MSDVLRFIGRNLASLELWKMSVEGIDAIVDSVPNLQYLEVLVELSPSFNQGSLRSKYGLSSVEACCPKAYPFSSVD